MRKALIGAVVTTLVVLLARSLAYATEPTPTARLLEQRVGGPALPVLALAVLALGAAIAVAVCWLAAVAVRERALIERRRAEAFPAFRVVALTLALALTTSVGGGLLEAYLHWRAGLGWHGLHCLLGPVHHDLIPFETGLSFVGAAVVAAAAHVVAWMRRTFARLGATLPRLWPVSSVRLRAL
jgi:MFS family permease